LEILNVLRKFAPSIYTMIKYKKIVSFILVALFVSDYINDHLFFHSHIIDGDVVIHSHIHSETHHETPNGGHSKQDFYVFIHYDDCSTPYYCRFIPTEFHFCAHKLIEANVHVSSIHFVNLKLRAPPVLAL